MANRRQRFLLVLLILLSSHRDVGAFTYRRRDLQLQSPDMICISGVQHKSASSRTLGGDSAVVQPCPTTAEEVSAYDAVVMDEHGYVKITLKDIRMRDDDGRPPRQRDLSDATRSSRDDAYYREVDGGSAVIRRYWNKLQAVFGQNVVNNNYGRSLEDNRGEGTDSTGQELVPEAASDTVLKSSTTSHHLQIYLVPLDDYTEMVTKSQCCYELEFGPPFPSWVETETVNGRERAVMPPECALRNRPGDFSKGGDTQSSFAHDYRANAPRTGGMQATTAPIIVNAEGEKKDGKHRNKKENNLGPGVHLIKTLRPEKLGRHMIVISNCAAELELSPPRERYEERFLGENGDDSTSTRQPKVRAAGLKAIVSEVEITFVSKFGELPLSMMGIIPFYGILLACYAILATVWWKRSMAPHPVTSKDKSSRWGHSSLGIRDAAFGGIMSGISGDYASVSLRPLLGLQRVLKSLIHLQLLFTGMAFAYYLHLNRTTVDIDVLYSGTAAALVDWSAFSMAVATAHFCTILGSQIVVTLATDGTWLIQQHIRPDTKKVLYGLIGVWVSFFILYGYLTPKSRGTLLIILGLAWVGFLLFNVRRSLQHLRTLMVGQDNENVIAVGGALVAKRSLYKKMCAIIAVYPVVFLVSLIWSSNAQQDSWTWVSYVLIDVYLFIILLHASVIWMPRPMASQEYVKYAPLEVSVTTNNDKDLWEEGIQETWSEDEVEMLFQ